MSAKSRGTAAESTPRSGMSRSLSFFLYLCCFFAGMFFTNRMWTMPSLDGIERNLDAKFKHETVVSEDHDSYPKKAVVRTDDGLEETSELTNVIEPLDQTILDLERKLAAARAQQEATSTGSPLSGSSKIVRSTSKHKYFMVVGINTSFRSRKRRDSIRATWMPEGETRKKLEKEKGIVLRFVIGHSASPGGILDKAIEAEDMMHGDFLRLEHVEGYHELSGKTKTYFATAVSLWDAEFYVKVDDDIHVNLATLGMILSSHRRKSRVYIGCMKSGPVLAQKGVRYHEPEYWKFGAVGNRYFRHATGQLYAISKDLATYISVNQNLLHKYANEDVSLGSWFIGLDVEHVHDRRFCCGTPPDCEYRAQAGSTCAASFDWRCSGICNSSFRIMEVHERCKEGEDALWSSSF
ncbi:probable beta-1,3-galactosyltransferase 2 isoform X1 [Punica granatum]|uniref:Hexosyltransferase n=2 Tax=Punica granatum TaxID=22663 RepID=A0A6P8DP97_PUNGR|nr:probable beta-1,3-galactosyltransferase 2 isoform X1 [Punica granatum]